MKRIVLTYGLAAGGVLSAMMLGTMPFMERIGYDRGEIIGYTTMVLAFLLVFFGIRSYRDTVCGGVISFGRAFRTGALITLVASACYVLTWQVIYYTMVPDFMERYSEHMIAEARADGATEQEIATRQEQAQRWSELYRNPLINVAITLLEILPVGLVVTAVCAAILRRRTAPGGLATALA